MDNSSTHSKLDPNLWLKVGSSGGLDKNKVYGISNTTNEDMHMIHSVSIIGSSQIGSSE